MVTLTIPAQQAARVKAPDILVEQSSAANIDEIAERLKVTGRSYQYHPVWSTQTLLSESRCRGISRSDFFVARDDSGVRGVICLWDQRAFKQSVVAGYSKRLGRVRPWFNLVAPVLRRPRLPPPGQHIESAFLSHLSVDPDDEATLFALLRKAANYALKRGIDYVMLGLAERNTLCDAIRKQLSCHSYVSMLYLVYWADGCEYASTIDNRIPHPEMAIL